MPSNPKAIKVRLAITVEIDMEAWTENYGVEGVAAIRADVATYAIAAVIDQFDAVGVLA